MCVRVSCIFPWRLVCCRGLRGYRMFTLPRTESRGDGVACFVKEGIEVLDRQVRQRRGECCSSERWRGIGFRLAVVWSFDVETPLVCMRPSLSAFALLVRVRYFTSPTAVYAVCIPMVAPSVTSDVPGLQPAAALLRQPTGEKTSVRGQDVTPPPRSTLLGYPCGYARRTCGSRASAGELRWSCG